MFRALGLFQPIATGVRQSFSSGGDMSLLTSIDLDIKHGVIGE